MANVPAVMPVPMVIPSSVPRPPPVAPPAEAMPAPPPPPRIEVPAGHKLNNGFIVIPPAPRTDFQISDFDLIRPLGGGQHGQVWLAELKGTNVVVALKQLNIAHLAKNNIAVQLRREVEIAFNTRHKHVLRTYGYFFNEQCVYLILEPCARGMLFVHLRRFGGFPPERAARFVGQLAEALLYLHRHHILHRDIKPENILLDHNDDIKVADFGWSVHDPKERRRTFCGTPEYFPPEIIARMPYNGAADLWSLGVFCFEMLVGATPFFQKEQDTDALCRKITEGSFTIPDTVPPEAKDLIISLLVQDADKRPTLRSVLAHPFLQKYYYSRLPEQTGGAAAGERRLRDGETQ